MGQSFAPRPEFEAAWELAERLEAAAVDRALGFHGTPRGVARALAALVVLPAGPLVDPACGAGALLLAGLERRFELTGRLDLEALHGADVDPRAVAMTRSVLRVAAGQVDSDPARGAPASGPGAPRLRVADFLRAGLALDDPAAVVLANPPWGVKVAPAAFADWRARVGPGLAELLEGEVNVYTLFLLETVLSRGLAAGFVTPIHWLHRRSLTRLRERLASSGRLAELVLLRKGVFVQAPDMIPALTAWRRTPSTDAIRVQRTGFRAPLPLPSPLPTASAAAVSAERWRALPFAAFPLLYSARFGALGRLLGEWPRLSDPEQPREQRWLHLGDGAYKSRVTPHVVAARDGGPPILTRAAEVGRYRRDPAARWLTDAGLAQLTPGERARFEGPKLVLHALKKAAAAWRLAGAVDDASEGPLALTNNFLVGTARQYTGDLYYPLALLNSRLVNRLYTELFPGVNIEACTVGVMPFAWPLADAGGHARPAVEADALAWFAWARNERVTVGFAPVTVYACLCELGRALQAARGGLAAVDRRTEAVVAGLFGATERELLDLLEASPRVES